MSFVYIGMDVRTENNQIALIIIILSTKFGPIINLCGHAHRSFEVGLNVDIRQMKNRSVS